MKCEYPIKPDSVLHRLLTMVAERVALEFSVRTETKSAPKDKCARPKSEDKRSL